MQGFKFTNMTELALILFMSTSCPGMGHVNESHPFQPEQRLVTGTEGLSLKDRTDSAELTDEGTPVGDAGKA
eukprot:scaffold1033_cov65-Cyclotella_meneghiniana.AAC.5